MRHLIGLSGGKDSTCLALALAGREPREYEFLCTPTGNELDEMQEHWRRLEGLLGRPLVRLRPFAGDGLRELILRWSALPNWRQRWCTKYLKILPTLAYLKEASPCTYYVGLRADEPEDERAGITTDLPGVSLRYPLREWGWGEDDVWRYLAGRGVQIPRRTDCAWCFGQRLVEWKRLWEQHPEVFEQAVQLEKLVGHTFRSAGRDSWPAALDELREEFRRGRRVRGEPRPGCIQLDLWDAGEPEQQSCRVCRL